MFVKTTRRRRGVFFAVLSGLSMDYHVSLLRRIRESLQQHRLMTDPVAVATNFSKSFFITGRLRDQGVRRLKQDNRHMIECFMPGGLERTGDGWKLSVRVRIIHAQIRRLLDNSDDWDRDAWGAPVSAAHLGFAITAFSARLLKHMENLGASYNDEERDSFMAVWRYTGYLMGIPDTILFEDETEALRLFEIGGMCEPTPGIKSMVMANALINSGPLLGGINNLLQILRRTGPTRHGHSPSLPKSRFCYPDLGPSCHETVDLPPTPWYYSSSRV